MEGTAYTTSGQGGWQRDGHSRRLGWERPIYHDWWMWDGGHGGMTMEVGMCCHIPGPRHDMGGQICYYWACRFSVFFALVLYLPPALSTYNGGWQAGIGWVYPAVWTCGWLLDVPCVACMEDLVGVVSVYSAKQA